MSGARGGRPRSPESSSPRSDVTGVSSAASGTRTISVLGSGDSACSSVRSRWRSGIGSPASTTSSSAGCREGRPADPPARSSVSSSNSSPVGSTSQPGAASSPALIGSSSMAATSICAALASVRVSATSKTSGVSGASGAGVAGAGSVFFFLQPSWLRLPWLLLSWLRGPSVAGLGGRGLREVFLGGSAGAAASTGSGPASPPPAAASTGSGLVGALSVARASACSGRFLFLILAPCIRKEGKSGRERPGSSPGGECFLKDIQIAGEGSPIHRGAGATPGTGLRAGATFRPSPRIESQVRPAGRALGAGCRDHPLPAPGRACEGAGILPVLAASIQYQTRVTQRSMPHAAPGPVGLTYRRRSSEQEGSLTIAPGRTQTTRLFSAGGRSGRSRLFQGPRSSRAHTSALPSFPLLA
jgi:hypothetical protein